MKHIKTYENINLKYKKDDYVIITGYPDFDPFVKIYLVNSKKSKRSWDYLVMGFEYSTQKIQGTYIDELDIIRKLTPYEIDEYEAKENAYKYNL